MSDDYQPQNVDEELRLRDQRQQYQEKAHRDVITGRLALVMVIVFGASLLGHYIAVAIFAARGNTAVVEALQNMFHEWLPVLTGLVSAVLSYYFAEKRK